MYSGIRPDCPARYPKCNLSLPKNNADFWKRKFERNIERDLEKRRALEQENWTVLVIWECDIKADLPLQLALVKQLLNDHS